MTSETKVTVPAVNLADPNDVRYWLDLWKVSEEKLRTAVEKAGTDASAVAFALGREAWMADVLAEQR